MVPGLSVFPSREPGMSGNFWMSHEGCQVPCLTSRRNMGLPLRRRTGQGPHLAKTLKPPRFSRVAAGFSSFDEDFRLPLGLALGSPISHSSSEGNLGVALESQGFVMSPSVTLGNSFINLAFMECRQMSGIVLDAEGWDGK